MVGKYKIIGKHRTWGMTEVWGSGLDFPEAAKHMETLKRSFGNIVRFSIVEDTGANNGLKYGV